MRLTYRQEPGIAKTVMLKLKDIGQKKYLNSAAFNRHAGRASA